MPEATSSILTNGAIPADEMAAADAERDECEARAAALLPAIDEVRRALGSERAEGEVKLMSTRPLSFRVRIRRHIRGFSDLRFWTVAGGDPVEAAVTYRWLTGLAGRLGWVVDVDHHEAGAAVTLWTPANEVDPDGEPISAAYHSEVAVALARALASAVRGDGAASPAPEVAEA